MYSVLALTAGAAGAQDLVFPPGEDPKFNWASYDEFAAANDLSGQTLTITGPWTGQDADLVQSMLAYFREATGATVNYSGSESFEQDIVISAQAGSAPNVAVFPQPGLVADLAAQGVHHHRATLVDVEAEQLLDGGVVGGRSLVVALDEGFDGAGIDGVAAFALLPQPLAVAGEALGQPYVAPAIRGHGVTEPLVGQLVGGDR